MTSPVCAMPPSRAILLLVGLLVTIRLGASPALAQDRSSADPSLTPQAIAFAFRYEAPSPPRNRSLSTDKALHFTGSAVWTLSTYYGLTGVADWPHRASLGTAAGSAAVLGVLKEMYDASKIGNHASGGDLVANALGIGVATGIILAQ